ncbi:MAG TPA: FHA domain-containing protein [Isosphaeraceae bacterium]|nr:FHA domain-containing protein [Isosphaeraceae bacterium]
MDYQLVVVRGRSATQTIHLANGVTTVGRQEGCQLRISSSQVSRRHCQLLEQQGALVVKDLGSSNGTFVNGRRISDAQVLQAGDEISIGQVRFRIEYRNPSDSSKPSDTAVAQAVADEDVPMTVLAEEGPDDEFAVTRGGEPATTAPRPAHARTGPEPEPTREVDEEEVAGFLLELDVDEDE